VQYGDFPPRIAGHFSPLAPWRKRGPAGPRIPGDFGLILPCAAHSNLISSCRRRRKTSPQVCESPLTHPEGHAVRDGDRDGVQSPRHRHCVFLIPDPGLFQPFSRPLPGPAVGDEGVNITPNHIPGQEALSPAGYRPVSPAGLILPRSQDLTDMTPDRGCGSRIGGISGRIRPRYLRQGARTRPSETKKRKERKSPTLRTLSSPVFPA
jgi:hypothetical protein